MTTNNHVMANNDLVFKSSYQMRVDRHGNDPFRISKQPIFLFYLGFVSQKNSLLKRDFDFILDRLFQGGIVDKILADNLIGWKEEVIESQLKPFELKHFAAAFLALVLGSLLSVFCFLTELFVMKN